MSCRLTSSMRGLCALDTLGSHIDDIGDAADCQAHGFAVKKIDPTFAVDEEWLNKHVERLVVKDIHDDVLDALPNVNVEKPIAGVISALNALKKDHRVSAVEISVSQELDSVGHLLQRLRDGHGSTNESKDNCCNPT